MSEPLDPGDRRATERTDERFGSAIREPHTSDAGIQRELPGIDRAETMRTELPRRQTVLARH